MILPWSSVITSAVACGMDVVTRLETRYIMHRSLRVWHEAHHKPL